MAGQRHHRSRGWKLFLAAVWCFLHFSRISDPALAVNPSLPSNPSDKASALRTNLQKLTVKQLQAQLREKGLTVSGRKAALVDRLLAVSEKLPDPSRVDSEQYTGEDRDWNKKILATGDYSSILPDKSMPFVNRQYELFQLLCENIDAILMLLDGPVKNFRRLNVCFSAQMFGAGKTTLGDNFLSQINSEAFEVYAREMISNRSHNEQKDWLAEWQRAKRARQLYVDVGGRRTVDGVLDAIQKKGNIATLQSSEDSVNRFADLVLTIASQEPDRALFVHIDELGELGNVVSLIRNGVRATWQRMNEEREKEMPRIYFFLSGKGIPIRAIGKATSPVGTRWILLDHLHQESGRDQQTRES